MLESLDKVIAFAVIMLVVSMLITVLVQLISGLLNLRGMNLVQSITETLQNSAPGLKIDGGALAKKLATHALTGPLLSDSSLWFFNVHRVASAVRPDELFDAIHRIATGLRDAPPEQRATAQHFLQSLGLKRENLVRAARWVEETQPSASLQAMRDEVLARFTPEQRSQQKFVRSLFDSYTAHQITDAAASAGQLVHDDEEAFEKSYRAFVYWFEIGQERAQEWFSTHARIVTVILAIILAFALQLDTADIYSFVSKDSAARNALVAQGTAVTSRAEAILAPHDSLAQAALDEARKASAPDSASVTATKDLKFANIETVEAAKAKIEAALSQVPAEEKAAFLKQFDTQLTKLTNERRDQLLADLKNVQSSLGTTGFELIPLDEEGHLRWRWPHFTCAHFFGILLSAALLSLGAPFWFNMLKNLTNLRSVVADNISDQKEAEGATAPATAPAKLPPTLASKTKPM